jgi:hypothetical protein
MADDDDDLHDRVNEMADRLGLKGRERSSYIHEHMTRGGYRAVPQYVKGDDDDDDDDDSRSPFFRGGSRSSDSDRRQTRRRPRTRRPRDDWYDED